jgi:hypothetical protein
MEWPMVDARAALTSRLLGRNGLPLTMTLPAVQVAAEAAVASLEFPLNSLPEGEFLVELTATAGETSERRLVAFKVVR